MPVYAGIVYEEHKPHHFQLIFKAKLLFSCSATHDQVVDYLSGWFCFVQTSQGQVVSVFHSQAENADAVNFKKGIAAAFQANLRGTLEETEIDPNSKHLSHYRLMLP